MDFKNKKAIYLQIADFVCEQIALGQWKEKILSIRELAVSLTVNPNTVVRAYTFLEQQGIIEMRRGIGYFATENARAQVLQLKKQEFLMEDLPQIWKTMELLNISFTEFKQLYDKRGQHEKK